ncbi:NADAR family protein [Runella sp.]|uniref:NADAR family protein n=1 Tax=Runella sp. TaxID=1960881 RepID=UPI003D11C9E3
MKYNLNRLIEQQDKPLKYLFFWGHQPSKDGNITKTCLSQWWESSFEVEGVVYPTAEHWMMAQKAKLFGDEDVFEQILDAKSPAEAKKLGRQIRNFDENAWLSEREKIVVEGNFHKFNQNKALKEFLLQTQQRVLAEASPVDAIWGIGLAADHVDVLYPEKWPGLNLLGFALMEVRDRLAKP